ncbi:polysaccharide pyruvyl transferase family protein [Vibrio vulnificus]|nr:polysaccharide pyruvyl transferase family protein [Vibrio vulnificus]EKA6052224.1 polysaccharide pyruvyl transferase family protein [Vibrio vulnificus]ELB7645891.1 polysaccharide pyruvyl transferase family protein [Vibrio vulnificus]
MKLIKLSPINGNNSGDILISYCVTNLLDELDIEVDSFDICFRSVGLYKNNKEQLKTTYRNKMSYFLQTKFPYVFYQIKKMMINYSGDVKKLSKLSGGYDGLIIGGGNLLMSNMGCDYAFRTLKYMQANNSMNSYILSCGAGPFQFEERRLIDGIVGSNCKISLRDEVSKEYFTKYGSDSDILVMPDPVFCLSDFVSNDADSSLVKNKLGVNIISGYFKDPELLLLANEIYKVLRKEKLDLKIINTAFPNDEQVANKLAIIIDSIDPNVVVQIVNVGGEAQDVANVFADVKLFVGCRMHSIIFALSMSIPSLGFKWDEKVYGMFEQFYKNSEYQPEEYIVDKDSSNLLSRVESIIHRDVGSSLIDTKERIRAGIKCLFLER